MDCDYVNDVCDIFPSRVACIRPCDAKDLLFVGLSFSTVIDFLSSHWHKCLCQVFVECDRILAKSSQDRK